MVKLWLLSVLILTPDGNFDLRHLVPVHPQRHTEQWCQISGKEYVNHLSATLKLPRHSFRVSCQQLSIPIYKLFGQSV